MAAKNRELDPEAQNKREDLLLTISCTFRIVQTDSHYPSVQLGSNWHGNVDIKHNLKKQFDMRNKE